MKKDKKNGVGNQPAQKIDLKASEAELYDEALQILEANTENLELYKKAHEILEHISGYKNSAKLLQECKDRILAITLKHDMAKRKRKKTIRNIIIAVAVVVIALLVVSAVATQNSEANKKYEEALQALEDAKNDTTLTDKKREQKYKTAYKTLIELGYSDVVFQNRLDRVKDFADAGSYTEAFTFISEQILVSETIFTREMSEAVDETTKYVEDKILADANAKLEAKNYYAALDLYRYLDVTNEQIADSVFICQTESIKTSKIFDVVRFGTYEINCETGDFDEDIEWYVVAKEGNKYMLVSKYVLDGQAFNKEAVATTWDKSSIRTWLNGDFAAKAFNEEELGKIVTTSVDTNGVKTNDKVFLLSAEEAEKYIASYLKAESSKYAYLVGTCSDVEEKSEGKETTFVYHCQAWWLRDTVNDTAITVDAAGKINTTAGHQVNMPNRGVRPAIWITID